MTNIMIAMELNPDAETFGQHLHRHHSRNSLCEPGNMVRWRVEAETSTGTRAKEPTFRLPRESPEYHGTVAIDPDID